MQSERHADLSRLARGSCRAPNGLQRYPIWVVRSGRTTTTTRVSLGGLPS